MNLLFDAHTFDAGPQGTTTFLAGLLNALPTVVGDEIALTCAAHERRHVDRFVRVPYRFASAPGGFLRRNLRELPRLTGMPGVEAVVSQYVRPFRSRVPTVSVIHDVLFLDFPALFGWRYRLARRLLFGWAARHSDVIITVSDYSRKRIAHHFGIRADRIDVLPNGVEVAAPLPADPPPSRDPAAPLRLLYVSRFETRKRQEWCVAAASALARRGRSVELTLVGNDSGDHAASVRAAIAADPVPGASIAICSDVAQHDLDRLYAETDLFLFPSSCEGFGIPVIEAAAHGIPCVVAANTAMIELGDRYAGRAVQDAGLETFVAAVVAAADTLPALRREAIAIAPQTRDAYRWTDIARRFVAILEQRGVVA